MSRRRTPYGAAVAQDSIRFLLNGAPVAATGVSPHLSLWNGCAGTAGLHRHQGRLRRGAIAAPALCSGRTGRRAGRACRAGQCLHPPPAVGGRQRQSFTIEGLGCARAPYHPVQQALADGHASQCSFCTPGFVMSLTALYKTRRAVARSGGVAGGQPVPLHRLPADRGSGARCRLRRLHRSRRGRDRRLAARASQVPTTPSPGGRDGPACGPGRAGAHQRPALRGRRGVWHAPRSTRGDEPPVREHPGLDGGRRDRRPDCGSTNNCGAPRC